MRVPITLLLFWLTVPLLAVERPNVLFIAVEDILRLAVRERAELLIIFQRVEYDVRCHVVTLLENVPGAHFRRVSVV